MRAPTTTVVATTGTAITASTTRIAIAACIFITVTIVTVVGTTIDRLFGSSVGRSKNRRGQAAFAHTRPPPSHTRVSEPVLALSPDDSLRSRRAKRFATFQ